MAGTDVGNGSGGPGGPEETGGKDQGHETQASNDSNSREVGSKRRSWVWDHFTENQGETSSKKRRATCNYCGTDYAWDPKLNGTISMKTHLESHCTKYPFRMVDKSQPTFGFKPKGEGESSASQVAVSFNAESCRTALAEMIIMDGLPFRFVEGEGFRNYMHVVQPTWTKLPSQITIAKDCHKLYMREKKKLKSVLKGQRICLTTDTWTSLQNLNYMCLTAHFIDSEWKLHKRILNFRIVENHKGETLGKSVEGCLLEWGIEKILTITVDNASSNNTMIDFLKRKTMDWPGTILDHEFLHMRCCAHILKLIVRDGLKNIDMSIARVRNAVRYVRSSPQRLKLFKQCADLVKIPIKAQVCLDVPTRWNSTYMMLDRAEKYKNAFERLEEEDGSFLFNVGVGEEVCDNGEESTSSRRERRMLGPPDKDDWEKIRLFAKFIELFYDATLKFSDTNHVTCNLLFMELVNIQDTIEAVCEESHQAQGRDISLKTMAYNMKSKFEKYWGNFENMNPMSYIGLVLDPRYKLKYIEFCFGSFYDQDKAVDLLNRVKDAMVRLYDSYVATVTNEKGVQGQEQRGTRIWNRGETSSQISTGGHNAMRALRMSQFKKLLEEANSVENKSDVERYLAESCEEDVEGFNILNWWKVNSTRFQVLGLVARDVLAIPVSSVALESAFSMAGRVLDPFRSALSPKTVETIVCAQNWLCSSAISSIQDAMDDGEDLDNLEQEFMEESMSFEAAESTSITH